MIALAIFDLDGTLIDSRLDLCLSVNHALRTVGLPRRDVDEIATFIGEGAARLVERAVSPRLDLLEPALAAWWKHYQAHLLDHTVLFPGIAQLLSDAPFRLAVQTNKPGAMARQILAGLGVLDRFVEVVGGDEVPRKPDPAGIRGILARQAVDPRLAVLVGDSLIDLETARAVPVSFVPVGWGLVSPERLQAASSAAPAASPLELRALLAMPR